VARLQPSHAQGRRHPDLAGAIRLDAANVPAGGSGHLVEPAVLEAKQAVVRSHPQRAVGAGFQGAHRGLHRGRDHDPIVAQARQPRGSADPGLAGPTGQYGDHLPGGQAVALGEQPLLRAPPAQQTFP
jgi:hypothetical protein